MNGIAYASSADWSPSASDAMIFHSKSRAKSVSGTVLTDIYSAVTKRRISLRMRGEKWIRIYNYVCGTPLNKLSANELTLVADAGPHFMSRVEQNSTSILLSKLHDHAETYPGGGKKCTQ